MQTIVQETSPIEREISVRLANVKIGAKIAAYRMGYICGDAQIRVAKLNIRKVFTLFETVYLVRIL